MSRHIDLVTDADVQRFWASVVKTPTCWLWTGDVNNHGYGRLALYRENRRYRLLVHRLSYWLAHGAVPKLLRHTCDTPACARPDHLLAGTQTDNMRDAASRGRINPYGLDLWRERRAVTVATRVTLGEKRCGSCRAVLPFSAFHRHSKSADGRQFWCIECMRRRKAERMEAA